MKEFFILGDSFVDNKVTIAEYDPKLREMVYSNLKYVDPLEALHLTIIATGEADIKESWGTLGAIVFIFGDESYTYVVQSSE